MELTHTDSNPRFDISVAFTANYFLVGGDIPVDNETFLVTDFVNFKIKPAPEPTSAGSCGLKLQLT
jgi:hypothetical protein